MGLVVQLIEACNASIAEKSDWLTKLDQAIGDGDHGINMKRGFAALSAQNKELDEMSIDDAMIKAGMILVSNVGGASGPLYGTLLMGLGKASKTGTPFENQVTQAIDAVKKRGKSDVGAKTLLDVLVPVAAELASTHDLDLNTRITAIRQKADHALQETKDMLATRGRASFLGERSQGHLDPGAASTNLLIHAICDVLEVQS